MGTLLKPDSRRLSVVIPSLREADNLRYLLPQLREALADLGIDYEVLVVDKASDDGTPAVVAENGARYVCEKMPGYGNAIMRGIREAEGTYVATMDADLSHPVPFIKDLWEARTQADVVIASRYVPGAKADQPRLRLWMSKLLNAFFRKGLSLDVHDMSSGYRLYRKQIFRDIEPHFSNFVILVDILLQAFRCGHGVAEVPFHYQPRYAGRSHAQVLRFGIDYLRLFYRVWCMRNSIEFPDYDWRAYDSRIPLQRYWQRKRHDIILRFATPAVTTLDVGCGSSRILADMPHAVAVDLRLEKLVFMKRTNRLLLQGDGCALPFTDDHFECVICSEVIEHIPDEGGRLLDELTRVLKPGGVLVIGTPDYGNWQWRVTERLYDFAAPNSYADEHVTHYTFDILKTALEARGYTVLDHEYICQGELIFQARLESAN
ncbi:MAG: glycosyltransferase [Candidatus Hydrogenedentota bacterium]